GKGDSSYRLDIDFAGQPRFADGDANQYVTGSTLVLDGQWHFLAGTYDGSTNFLYVDGLLNAGKAAPNPILGNPNDVWVGDDPDNFGHVFHGTVDEVAIFPYALSAAQIFHIFSGAFLPPTRSL